MVDTFYLKYQNRKIEDLENWGNVLNIGMGSKNYKIGKAIQCHE